MDELPRSVAALLVAEACNVGPTRVVAEGHPSLARARLGHVDANYLLNETHVAAETTLIKAQAEIPVAQVWRGGLLASVVCSSWSRYARSSLPRTRSISAEDAD